MYCRLSFRGFSGVNLRQILRSSGWNFHAVLEPLLARSLLVYFVQNPDRRAGAHLAQREANLPLAH